MLHSKGNTYFLKINKDSLEYMKSVISCINFLKCSCYPTGPLTQLESGAGGTHFNPPKKKSKFKERAAQKVFSVLLIKKMY